MDETYLDLFDSSRVLPATRKVLEERSAPRTNYEPQAIRSDLYSVLEAVLGRLIPQNDKAEPIDIAAQLDTQHLLGKGNGWRYADMPPDREALELGLKLVETSCHSRFGEGFSKLSPDRQDQILSEIQSGEIRWAGLNSKRWFEELHGDATSIFVSQPGTLAEIGFSGIAILPRWEKIGLDQAEGWEPQAIGEPLGQ